MSYCDFLKVFSFKTLHILFSKYNSYFILPINDINFGNLHLKKTVN